MISVRTELVYNPVQKKLFLVLFIFFLITYRWGIGDFLENDLKSPKKRNDLKFCYDLWVSIYGYTKNARVRGSVPPKNRTSGSAPGLKIASPGPGQPCGRIYYSRNSLFNNCTVKSLIYHQTFC